MPALGHDEAALSCALFTQVAHVLSVASRGDRFSLRRLCAERESKFLNREKDLLRFSRRPARGNAGSCS
jgi:hypothetical protein